MQSTEVSKTKKIALSAILFATALVLSFVEHSFPPVFSGVPGIRLGLSNIMVMYCLFFLGKGQAMVIVVLKGFFVLATRGMIAGLLSLVGGLSSLTVMILLLFIFKEKISYFMLSVAGAVFHNAGQYTVFYILYPNVGLWTYLPFLFLFGIAAGVVTAKLLSVILPAIDKLGLNKKI